jgi:hypothetical protein
VPLCAAPNSASSASSCRRAYRRRAFAEMPQAPERCSSSAAASAACVRVDSSSPCEPVFQINSGPLPVRHPGHWESSLVGRGNYDAGLLDQRRSAEKFYGRGRPASTGVGATRSSIPLRRLPPPAAHRNPKPSPKRRRMRPCVPVPPRARAAPGTGYLPACGADPRDKHSPCRPE